MRNNRNFWANLKRWNINGNMDEGWNNVRGRIYRMDMYGEGCKKEKPKRKSNDEIVDELKGIV